MRTGTPDELREALGGPPPEQPGDPLAAMELLTDVALPHMQHGDHPALLRPGSRPVVVRRRAGRLAGHRLQRHRGVVEGRLRPGDRRAGRARLAALSCSACPRAPRACWPAAARWPTSPRWRRARAVDGPGRRVPLRPDALVDRPRAGRAGLRPRRGADDPDRRRDADAARRRGRGDRRGPRRPAGARASSSPARAPPTPAPSIRCTSSPTCAPSGDVVPRRRRLRCAGGAVRARPARARRHRARRLAGARPAQVAVPAVRRRLPAGAPARRARPGVPHDAGVPARRRRDRRRGRLPQPQPRAVDGARGR